MRWSLKLCKFDFTVEHRPGRKIPHADALSRHIGSISQEKSLDPERVLREQAKDEFCKNIKLSDLSKRSEFFWMTLVLYIGADAKADTNWWYPEP
jgi:hypothetical protein